MLNFVEQQGPIWINSDLSQIDQRIDSILTVVSFNIQFGIRLEEAKKALLSFPFQKADIVLLQEMDESGTIYLSEQLNYNYLYYPISTHPKHNRKFGNAILSKWPISKPEKIILPHAQPINGLMRSVTSGIIHFGDMDIKTYSIHMETPVMHRFKRIQQLQHTIDRINAVNHTDYVVFGGDFNSLFTRDVRDMVDLCLSNNLNWASKDVGHSLAKYKFVKLTLDHIFSKGFEIVASGKIENTVASDHFPIWTKLKIP